MTTFTNIPNQVEELLNAWSGSISRRNFLERSGRLVVSVSAAALAGPFAATAGAQAPGPYPDPNFRQLDSWIVIHEDSTATFYVGKTDCGQGTGTAFRQMMSDELDIAYDKTTCIMGSTDITVDQGGSGGSDAIQTDGWPMRRVAAEARRVLLEMASARFGVPVDQLAVSEATIKVKADPSKSVTYGQLIGGKKFNVALTGSNIDATTGQAKVKPVQDLKIVGLSPQRYDIPAQGGRLVEVGRGREAAGYGACAQRQAAGGRREVDEHRRVLRARHSRLRQGRQQRQLRRGGVRAGRAGHQGVETAQGQLAEAGDPVLPVLGRSLRLHAQRDADVEPKAASSWGIPTRR